VCAPACTYALDHNIDRLADDHANGACAGARLSQINGIEVQEPETNLVFFKPDGSGVPARKWSPNCAGAACWLAIDERRFRALHAISMFRLT